MDGEVNNRNVRIVGDVKRDEQHETDAYETDNIEQHRRRTTGDRHTRQTHETQQTQETQTRRTTRDGQTQETQETDNTRRTDAGDGQTQETDTRRG